MQHAHWRKALNLSSTALVGVANRAEKFIDAAGFDRAPWAVVCFGTGIALWFWLGNRWDWMALIALALGLAAAAWGGLSGGGRYPFLRLALTTAGLMLAAGCGCVWAKSAAVGTPPLAHTVMPNIIATVLAREDQPAFGQVRLQLAMREPQSGRPIRVAVTLPDAQDQPALAEGAIVNLRARLMPPSSPILPGTRDMAQEEWFSGIAGSGRAFGQIVVLRPPPGDNWVARARHVLAEHVHREIPGSAGGIAATLVSGNRGAIAWDDQQAMRDAGLTHLLAISGLHVSAVVGGAWLLAFRLLALWPWLALRVRLPVVATGAGALAGIGYTVLTGAHLPTVRACVGALLVVGAVGLGRQPLSMRLLGIAAMAVMLLWPESVVGPSFQMSFGSVIAIIALHEAAPVHAFIAPREEAWWRRVRRHLVMILLGGMVIDLALMPVALFHFHRAGVYGSVANLIAIPLVTFVSMPLITLALALDGVGMAVGLPQISHPAWWAAGHSLNALLAMTHWIVARPGSVSLLPGMAGGSYVLFVGGMLWLALTRGRVRLLGLMPALVAAASLAALRPPDVLITGDGRNLGVVSEDAASLMVLHQGRSSYTRETLLEAAGISSNIAPLTEWPGAACNTDFCQMELSRGGRLWRILIARNKAFIPYAAMARACAGADIVVTQVRLYGPCHPALLKADRAMLMRTGGLALDLVRRNVTAVEDSEGEHPWWRAPHRLPAHSADEWEIADMAGSNNTAEASGTAGSPAITPAASTTAPRNTPPQDTR